MEFGAIGERKKKTFCMHYADNFRMLRRNKSEIDKTQL